MSAEVIAVCNHKGGVGKSTCTACLAVALARAGWRVLLVDLDAQANATELLLGKNLKLAYDLYDVAGDGVPAREAILPTRVAGLEVLPSSLRVALLEQQLFPMLRREEAIARCLAPVLDDYHVVLMDFPPNLGLLVIAGLCASTSLLIPTDVTEWGARGVRMFLDWSQPLRAARVLTADLLGVLLTKYEEQLLVTRSIREDLAADGIPVLATTIPKRTAFERMIRQGVLIGDTSADVDVASAFVTAAAELGNLVLATQKRRGRHRV